MIKLLLILLLVSNFANAEAVISYSWSAVTERENKVKILPAEKIKYIVRYKEKNSAELFIETTALKVDIPLPFGSYEIQVKACDELSCGKYTAIRYFNLAEDVKKPRYTSIKLIKAI